MPTYFKNVRESTATIGIWQQFILATINKLNLVTREEFAIQAQVLQKLHARVVALERQLMELEAKNNR